MGKTHRPNATEALETEQPQCLFYLKKRFASRTSAHDIIYILVIFVLLNIRVSVPGSVTIPEIHFFQK